MGGMANELATEPVTFVGLDINHNKPSWTKLIRFVDLRHRGDRSGREIVELL